MSMLSTSKLVIVMRGMNSLEGILCMSCANRNSLIKFESTENPGVDSRGGMTQ